MVSKALLWVLLGPLLDLAVIDGPDVQWVWVMATFISDPHRHQVCGKEAIPSGLVLGDNELG